MSVVSSVCRDRSGREARSDLTRSARAIALENANQRRAAARAYREAAELAPDAAQRELILARAGALSGKAPSQPAAQFGAPGRFLTHFGGAVTNDSSGTNALLFGRGAIFVQQGIDVGADLGYSSASAGLSLGLSARAWQHLTGQYHWTSTAGLALISGNFSVTYGLGLSWIAPNGVGIDILLKGALSSGGSTTPALLFGVTRYFGR